MTNPDEITEHKSYMKRLLEHRGMTQAQLARLLGTKAQQVSKFTTGGRKITPEWAKKMEPLLNVPWPMLVEGKMPDDAPVDTPLRIEVPKGVQTKRDPEITREQQLSVIEIIWPTLSSEARGAIFATVLAFGKARGAKVPDPSICTS